jgi:hypothetical protein
MIAMVQALRSKCLTQTALTSNFDWTERKKAKAASRSNEVSAKATQLIESSRSRAEDVRNEIEGAL